VNQTSWIYRFEATASCHILCDPVVENKVTLGNDLSRTTAAYTMWAATSLLPSSYDDAGAHNAVNPALYNRVWSTNLFFQGEPVVQQSGVLARGIHAITIHSFRDDTNFCNFTSPGAITILEQRY
jgi:Flp pilus assembly protein CpaB